MEHKILIVDDESNVLRLITEALTPEYRVLSAAEGTAAVAVIEKERPDLVFLDIKMPGVSGLDVLRTLKEKGLSPVVWMLTGEEDLETVTKALQLGAAGYLTKPFEVSQIRKIAVNAVESVSGNEKRAEPGDKPWKLREK